MPVFFAPSLPAPVISPGLPSPIVAPGINSPVPFIRPGLPPVPPIPPAIPALLPALPALGAPVAAPAAGGLARVAVRGAALLGALGLGLAIGNEVYEEVLNRPFGPSLQDLYFPEAQPEPLPVPEPLPGPDPRGYCPTLYNLTFTYESSFQGRPVESSIGYGIDLQGPISFGRFETPQAGGLNIYANTALGEVQLTGRGGAFGSWSQLKLTSFIPQRKDNQPDDCLEYVPEPVAPPRALPRPRRPQAPQPIPQPQPELEPFRPPFIPRLPAFPDIPYVPFVPDIGRPFEPELVPPDFLIPFTPPLPITPREPVTQPERERNPDGTLRVMAPPLPGFECCPSLETMVREIRDRTEPEECDLSEVERLLRDVLDKLCVEGTGTLDLTPCNAEEPFTIPYQGMGIAGLFSAVDAIAASLNVIHSDTKCPPDDCVAAVPDWWQMRPGADRPQLSVIFRKGGTRNYHAINIPHPITDPQPSVTPIGPYMAGNFQATIVCIDNSKFIVNADSRAEAERVALEASLAIRPIMLGSPMKISITERRGYPVSVDIMEPRYMQFFPEGQQSRRPEWKKDFQA